MKQPIFASTGLLESYIRRMSVGVCLSSLECRARLPAVKVSDPVGQRTILPKESGCGCVAEHVLMRDNPVESRDTRGAPPLQNVQIGDQNLQTGGTIHPHASKPEDDSFTRLRSTVPGSGTKNMTESLILLQLPHHFSSDGKCASWNLSSGVVANAVCPTRYSSRQVVCLAPCPEQR
jgi:hypothetical protein